MALGVRSLLLKLALQTPPSAVTAGFLNPRFDPKVSHVAVRLKCLSVFCAALQGLPHLLVSFPSVVDSFS